MNTTHDCLVDFLKDERRIEKLADALHVRVQSVKKWRGGRMPLGMTLVHLRSLLALFGYDIPEYKNLDPVLPAIGECITFGLVTEPEVRKELGLVDDNSFIRYYYSKKESMAHQRKKLWDIVNRCLDRLPLQKEKVKQHFALCDVIPKTKLEASKDPPQALPHPEAAKPPVRTPHPPSNGHALTGVSLDKRIQEFSRHCAYVRELGETFLDGSLEDRKALRRHMNEGRPQIHDTWSVLHSLMKEQRGDETINKINTKATK